MVKPKGRCNIRKSFPFRYVEPDFVITYQISQDVCIHDAFGLQCYQTQGTIINVGSKLKRHFGSKSLNVESHRKS
ncbi:MAG: hypothetical protein SRB2_03812 [Desulfobacteraceae bacterium Eth-SRB2]|nr:MAG: hypothetical protein SRB2_03812 [Desulfobacteraceae bacterium Eth-SRB2]